MAGRALLIAHHGPFRTSLASWLAALAGCSFGAAAPLRVDPSFLQRAEAEGWDHYTFTPEGSTLRFTQTHANTTQAPRTANRFDRNEVVSTGHTGDGLGEPMFLQPPESFASRLVEVSLP